MFKTAMPSGLHSFDEFAGFRFCNIFNRSEMFDVIHKHSPPQNQAGVIPAQRAISFDGVDIPISKTAASKLLSGGETVSDVQVRCCNFSQNSCARTFAK